MALTYSFPGPSGRAKSSDVRRDISGLVVRDVNNKVRRGVLPGMPNKEIAFPTPDGGMSVDVLPFEAVLERDGALLISNDIRMTIPAPEAPSANKRYHVLYIKQNESVAYSDPSDDAVIGWVTGPATTNPDLATAMALIPEGGMRIASFLVPAGVTSMTNSVVKYQQDYPFTALTGGPIFFRTMAERDSFEAIYGQDCHVFDSNIRWTKINSTWMITGGDRPHLEFTSSMGMADKVLQYPKLAFDPNTSNTSQGVAPLWMWESGPSAGSESGLQFYQPGDYDLIAHWTLPGPTISRGFIGFESETNQILARASLPAGEDRVSVALPAQRITRSDYRMRLVCYKENGTLANNTIRVKAVRSQ